MNFTPVLMPILHEKLVPNYIFLDISKALDRVCHECLLYKLKTYDINGSLLTLIKLFLTNRFQIELVNG